uniref:Uncharacterized protein n=1 Tax=Romanomermis culicivorax TaxID=13658 RepID=A0A915KPM6_ROMCU
MVSPAVPPPPPKYARPVTPDTSKMMTHVGNANILVSYRIPKKMATVEQPPAAVATPAPPAYFAAEDHRQAFLQTLQWKSSTN